MKGISKLLLLAVGAVSGGATAWYFAKKKYEKKAQEDIDSVKRACARKYEAKQEPTIKKAEQLAEELGYVGKTDRPYVIAPSEFGQIDEYEQIDLIYYRDGILADDNNDRMKDEEIERVIGKDSLTHFGEYEEDSVYVRNDRMKCDYAIILDQRRYSESIPLYKERK